jgi:hypothetical protein
LLDYLEEKEINPCDIPTLASSSKADAVGKTSTGIRKGEIVIYESGNYGDLGRGGSLPGPDSNHSKYSCVYAINEIAAGTVINAADVRHHTVYLNCRTTEKHPDFVMYPEGRRAKYAISIGSIITENSLEP